MDINYEISTNPSILIDENFDPDLVQLEGIKLGNDYTKIEYSNIVGVYVIDYDEPYSNFSEQLKQFRNKNGFIHMAGKFSFGIKNQEINEIKLSGKYIDSIQKIKKKDIVKLFGNPDIVLTDSIYWGGADYCVYGKILAYLDKKLYFNIDEKTKRVSEVLIGNVDHSRYDS